MTPTHKKISKYLSYILRHKPQSIGLKLDANGWANIDELIAKTTQMELSRQDIEIVVENNSKQRFAIDGDKIRANQGHSIEVDLALEPQTPPDILYHGTATRFIDSINQNGLLPQSRQHVHLSSDKDTAIEVGKRHGKVVVLEIDCTQMATDGYSFYLSHNGVWLTDAVPKEYIINLR